MEGVVSEIDAKRGEDSEEYEAKVFVSLHLGGPLCAGSGMPDAPRLIEVAPCLVDTFGMEERANK